MPNTSIPSPPGRFISGHMREASRRPLEYMLEITRAHGDIVQLRLGPSRMIIVNHPDHVKRVLQEKHSHYGRPAFVALLRRIVGNGLLFSEGDAWLKQRRIMQPSFHRERITAFAEIMRQAVAERVEQWRQRERSDQPLDMTREAAELITAINGPVLFASDLTREAPELGQAIRVLLNWLNERTLQPLAAPLFIPTAENRRFNAAKRLFTDTISRLISEHRAHAGTDLLSMLLAARDADSGESMGDKQLQDEVFTFLVAGLETTAAALQWALTLLAQHPEALQRVRAEHKSVCGSEPPRADQVASMRFTRMVIDETLRLYPPVYGLTRRVISDDKIAGYDIPKGAQVLVSPYAIHRHPQFWQHPESFAPEAHFAPEHSEGRSRFAYIPFGAGPRQCIGNALAVMELQILLPTLAAAFDFSLADTTGITPEPSMTLRPKGPVLMHARPVA
ncbi:MAG TPA: cytochrome P450 [Polyangiales bacterium]|nr:cytochrome P450 [Polyangiales bacterium]